MTTILAAPTAQLAAKVSGRVLGPQDDGYAALATPWNVARISAGPSAPVAVVEVADAADVQAAVRFAATFGIEVAVQLTGHGATRFTRPTLLVQTGRLDELTITGGSARVGAGVRWKQVLEAAVPLGFAGLAGSAPDVGVVGYLTGGGMSPVGRSYGYGSDHVTAFDVVTGDGELRRATATENPALFWGLRGGKGALGIVTAVEFDLVAPAWILGGCLYFDGADAAAVVHAWRDWTQDLPEEASTSLAILRLPEMPAVPAPLAGRTTVAVRFAWTGNPAEGKQVVAPMTLAAPVIFGGVDVMPFTAVGMIHSDPVDPMPVHERAMLLRELPAQAVDALLAVAGPDAACPQVIVEMRLMGGAIARAPKVPSAVCHRDAAYTIMTIGMDIPPLIEATDANAEQVMAALSPWSDGVGLPNFAISADPAVVARNYDAATLDRLRSLAEAYDPHMVIAGAHAVRR
jgi:FAD/FMN-containing dehydrogenase